MVSERIGDQAADLSRMFGVDPSQFAKDIAKNLFVKLNYHIKWKDLKYNLSELQCEELLNDIQQKDIITKGKCCKQLTSY